MWVEPLVRIGIRWQQQLRTLARLFEEELSFSSKLIPCGRHMEGFILHLAGPGIWPLARAEAGIHMICRQQENLIPVQVAVLPRSESGDVVQQIIAKREAWLASLRDGRATTADDPFPLGDILRFYDVAGPTIDLRSGLSQQTFPKPKEWKTLLLAGLPLPPELAVPAEVNS